MSLDQGRAAFANRAWVQARDLLAAADGESALEGEFLCMLAVAAQLAGDDALSDTARQRLFHRCRDDGDDAGAVRVAFFLGMGLMTRGQQAQAGAWIGRASELAETLDPECAERGYVMVPHALRLLGSGDAPAALVLFEEVLAIGTACADTDLATLGRLGGGQARLNLGRIQEGLVVLDRAMIAVTTDEVSPIIAGIVYCAVVEACHDIGDLGRAREWTRALSAWCDSQPDLVPFRGRCLVHRSEILQLDGSWGQASAEAVRACALLSDPPGQPPLGAALYQLAELQRLHGDVESADETYRRASEYGREPQPGLALLRLANGDPSTAAGTLVRVLGEGLLAGQRPAMLAAHVEVAIAAGRHDDARRSVEELADIVASNDEPFLAALAALSLGRVALADRDAGAALPELREAVRLWGEFGAVYEIARSRELIGQACAMLGDLDTADLESSAARATYDRLGAVLDVARIDAASSEEESPGPGAGLTGREVEVLRHVASGQTNRQIAEQLFISEKTVARHVSNIFTKVDVPSRAAATAYAYEHDLV